MSNHGIKPFGSGICGMQSDSFRVLIVSANERLRSVLPTLLGRQNALVYQGSVANASEALACVGTDMPDVVISDSPPADLQDILIWRAIHELGPRLIMLTRYMEQLIDTRAVLAGASGLILVPERRLADAVQRVAIGDNLRSLELSGRLRALVTGEIPSNLNGEERKVFGLVSEGRRDSEIAAHLGTSAENVRSQIVRIAEKLS